MGDPPCGKVSKFWVPEGSMFIQGSHMEVGDKRGHSELLNFGVAPWVRLNRGLEYWDSR